MTLRLTAREQVAVAETMQTLLTPLAHPDAAAWALAVTRSLKTVLAADMATFFLPTADRFVIQCEEMDVATLAAYPGAVLPVATRVSLWERLVRWGTYGRRELWQPHLEAYYRSEYFNDYLVPQRAFDAIGMAMLAPGKETAEPAFLTIAQVILHHDDPRTPSFGSRGVATLRLLEPSFRAGVAALHWQERSRGSLSRLLDHLGQSLVVADLAGRVLHRTPSLQALLAAEPEAAILEAAVTAAVADVAAIARVRASGGGNSPPIGDVTTSTVRTARGAYRLTASVLPPDVLRSAPLVAVQLDRTARVALADADLRARFGLTAREIEVARRLAIGSFTRAVADELGISLHTVRRHSERIFTKLDVTSRAALAHRLAGG